MGRPHSVLGGGGCPWSYIKQGFDMNTVLVILRPQFTHQNTEIMPGMHM